MATRNDYNNPEYNLISLKAGNVTHPKYSSIVAVVNNDGSITLNFTIEGIIMEDNTITSGMHDYNDGPGINLDIPLEKPLYLIPGQYKYSIDIISDNFEIVPGTTIPITYVLTNDIDSPSELPSITTSSATTEINYPNPSSQITGYIEPGGSNEDYHYPNSEKLKKPYYIYTKLSLKLGSAGTASYIAISNNKKYDDTVFSNFTFKPIFNCLSCTGEDLPIEAYEDVSGSYTLPQSDIITQNESYITTQEMGIMTNKLESFLDNNSPGGFVQTSINISSDDLSTRINTILQNKNFLSVNSRINYSQIDNAPVFADIALSGEYKDLKHSPDLASVAITGNYNDLNNKPIISGNNGGNNGGNNQRQIYYNELVGAPTLATVAKTGSYNDLIDKPNSFATVAFSGNFNDLDFVPNFVERENLSNAAFSGDYNDLLNAPEGVDSDDIIHHFDISNTDCQPLKYLANNLIDTTTVLSQQNNANYTIELFLIDLMNTYFDTPEIDPNDETEINLNHYQSSVVIKVTTFLGDMILTGIHQQDSSFVFTFTPLDMNTYLLTTKTNEHITGNDVQAETILNELTPNYFYPVLIFVPAKHELWIKRMTLILQEQLKTVAVTGSYNDLIDTPQLKKVATTGAYIDLEGVPALKTVATSGSYTDLINRPTLAEVATSGSYNDLINRPTLAEVATTGSYNSLADIPTLSAVALSGSYNSLEDRPNLADVALTGSYLNLTNRPDFATVAFTGSYNNLLDKPVIAQSNDIIKIFNVGNFSSNLLKTFSPGEVNTTGRISNDVDASTINNWLEDIINAYKYNNVFNLNIIKITNNKQQLILTYIEENNDIYIFHFTPISENNLQQLINDNIPLTENNITFSNYFVYFIYDKSRDKLFIYNKNIT